MGQAIARPICIFHFRLDYGFFFFPPNNPPSALFSAPAAAGFPPATPERPVARPPVPPPAQLNCDFSKLAVAPPTSGVNCGFAVVPLQVHGTTANPQFLQFAAPPPNAPP